MIEPKLSGKVIGNTIVKAISSLGLNIQNCVGQGYDGAAVMSSLRVGAASVVLELNKCATYNHCVAHALNLVMVQCSKIPQMRNMIGTVKETINFIKGSPKRFTVFKAAVKHLLPDEDQANLKTLCETRWIEKHEAIENFIQLISAIKLTLDQVIFGIFS